MRKKLLVAFTAAAMFTAAAPAVAPASDWLIDPWTTVTSPTPATATGAISVHMVAVGYDITCHVTLDITLDAGATLTVDGATFDTPCDTTINSGCKIVLASGLNLPWHGIGDDATGELPLSGVKMSMKFGSSLSCGGFKDGTISPTAAGDITPTVSGNTITFNGTSSGVLSSQVGPVNITGSLDLEDLGANPATLVP